MVLGWVGSVTQLEGLTKGALGRGVLGGCVVKVAYTAWHGSWPVTLSRADDLPGKAHQSLYREDEVRLVVRKAGRIRSMDADENLFRLVSEAEWMLLVTWVILHIAVQASTLYFRSRLQIEFVYEKWLPCKPLRFLLADDLCISQTIMAGLFCMGPMIRGYVGRRLIVASYSLEEQRQDEPRDKFALSFEILVKDLIEAIGSGAAFGEWPLLIAHLDHASRNEDLQAKLAATDWDLVVVDEAHKMAAHYTGGEIKETKRYKLGRLAGSLARHFVLMTATPHAGIEEDFQLFLALLDGDRFEGKPRDASHSIDTSDLMRRLVKEKLLKFDGTPLFPERRAYTAVYPLSDDETLLYKRVTDYVVEEMNRADRLKAEGEGRRGAIVGFALTTLQRRLASSPEAIYQSLSRRHKRLEKRIGEERTRRRGAELAAWRARGDIRALDDDADLDDLPEGELEELEEELVDEASAARTIADLEQEIANLADLEELARQLRDSGADRKWEELSHILQDTPEMYDSEGNRRKLIVFSEHRDTLNYLVRKLRVLLGRDDAVVSIHGGVPRDQRRKIQEAFIHDKEVLILVATDAAGRGSTFSVPTSWSTTTCPGTRTVSSSGSAGFTASVRPRSATYGTWLPRTPVRARCSSGSSRSWRNSVRRSVIKFSTSSARPSAERACATC